MLLVHVLLSRSTAAHRGSVASRAALCLTASLAASLAATLATAISPVTSSLASFLPPPPLLLLLLLLLPTKEKAICESKCGN